MVKSADAFRTISEVAEWLETPAHVLRFWESKFSQVKPVKRAGGRRYYRPTDMQLLGGIKKLLHEDGMTIKGVQKILREHGIKHVATFSQPLDEVTEIEAGEAAALIQTQDASETDVEGSTAAENAAPADEDPTVVAFQVNPDQGDTEMGPEQVQAPEPEPEPVTVPEPEPEAPAAAETEAEGAADTKPEKEPAPLMFSHSAPAPVKTPEPEPAAEAQESPEPSPPLPSFLKSPAAPEPAPEAEAPAPAPAPLDVPDDPADDLPAEPSVMTALADATALTPDQQRQINDLAARLKSLRG